MKPARNDAKRRIDNVDRRAFFKKTGALVVAFNFPLDVTATTKTASAGGKVPLNVVDSWLTIDDAGKVTLFCGKVELGTGIKTAFAQIVAEELDVPLARVEVIHGDTARTPDQGVTSASRSIAVGGPPVRQAAAEARQALLELASKRLGVPPSEMTVADGIVSAGSARVSYAELVGGRKFNRGISGKAPLKKSSEYKVVGTSAQRVDIPGKVTGRHTYVQDMRAPNMLHARVIRPAAVGARLVRVVGFPRSRPNVRIVSKKDFLAVVAPTEWEAIQAATELKAEWSDGSGLPSMAKFDEVLRSMPSHDVAIKTNGDINAGFQRASKTLTATYSWPFQSHGSIGPSCALADVRKDGTATIWSATQDVYMQREAIARLLGFATENVRVIYVEGSGCYGHNGADDVNGDAALLSQELGRPVRVQWMRHDELGWAPRGAPYLVDMKAGLDEAGELTAWDRQAWVLTHSARYSYYGQRVSGYLLATQLGGGEINVPLIAEPGKIINNAAIAGVRTVPYEVPNLRTLVHGLQTTEPHPLRPTELRSVSGLGGLFACESFIDELAAAAGQDPLQFRLARLKNPRAIEVLQAVAQLAGWESRSSPKPRRQNEKVVAGRGIALYGESTYVAVVAEVEVNTESGQLRVTRVNVAHDCGLIVNPDGLKNQIEGNVVQSTSRCLLEQVKWDDKRVISVDWMSYPILRFPDVPDVRMTLINRPDLPATGAGEATTYPMAGAIGNAVFDAVGVRLRQGPFTTERMKSALMARAGGEETTAQARQA